MFTQKEQAIILDFQAIGNLSTKIASSRLEPELGTVVVRSPSCRPEPDCVKSLFLCCLFTVNLKSRLLLKQLKEPLKAMSEHVNGTNRDQTVLFPDTIDKYVDKENPVRFIDAFVDSLNLEKLGFKHSVLADTGRPSYNPSDLLKLYVYGYLNQVRSSRKLEKECHRNVEVMWLMKKLSPDHKTIAALQKRQHRLH